MDLDADISSSGKRPRSVTVSPVWSQTSLEDSLVLDPSNIIVNLIGNGIQDPSPRPRKVIIRLSGPVPQPASKSTEKHPLRDQATNQERRAMNQLVSKRERLVKELLFLQAAGSLLDFNPSSPASTAGFSRYEQGLIPIDTRTPLPLPPVRPMRPLAASAPIPAYQSPMSPSAIAVGRKKKKKKKKKAVQELQLPPGLNPLSILAGLDLKYPDSLGPAPSKSVIERETQQANRDTVVLKRVADLQMQGLLYCLFRLYQQIELIFIFFIFCFSD